MPPVCLCTEAFGWVLIIGLLLIPAVIIDGMVRWYRKERK